MKIRLTPFHLIFITAGVLLLFFFISLIAFGVQKGDKVRRVLFFPERFNGNLNGEVRYLKHQKNFEQNIRYFIDELLLGPSLPHLSRLFPKETKLLSLIVKDNLLFINFSKEMIFLDKTIPPNMDFVLKACISNIDFNFTRIKRICIYINGEYIALEKNDPITAGESGEKVKFYDSLLK
jgi:hypothetical protein